MIQEQNWILRTIYFIVKYSKYEFKVIAAPFSCMEEQTLLLCGWQPLKGFRLQTKAWRAFHYKIKSSLNPILHQDHHFAYEFKVITAPFYCLEVQALP